MLNDVFGGHFVVKLWSEEKDLESRLFKKVHLYNRQPVEHFHGGAELPPEGQPYLHQGKHTCLRRDGLSPILG